jgi:CBS domain-containing protein
MLGRMRASPSPNLTANLRRELERWPPFAQMLPAHVDRFIESATEAYYAPNETVLSPADGPVQQVFLIRRGSVSARLGGDTEPAVTHYEAGEMFPLDAAMSARAVASTYVALSDTFCLQLPLASMHELARESAPFADLLNRRIQQYLALSQRALQVASAAQSLAEHSLETPLGEMIRRSAVGVAPTTPLASALQLMHDRRVGSILVIEPGSGSAVGILTRHDLLGRVTLANRPLSTPIAEVMSTPLITLGLHRTAQDAALAMSRHGIRHVPVVDDAGRVAGMVSERDLFALQRLSLKQVSTAIRAAPDLATLRVVATDIRRFARNLLGQGVGARQLTELISHLNDVLTGQLVTLVAASRGIDLSRACWLAFGSEGRGEQTIATDQDNGIVFAGDDPARDRPGWLALANEVNEGLDACGYPLCRGNVMARNPECCLSQGEWLERFAGWIEGGEPEDLLKASIFFDLRPLVGDAALAQPLRDLVLQRAGRQPRFIRLMAENALRHGPALSWHGGLEVKHHGGRDVVDLKLHGTAVYVEAARLYALAHGIAATSTRERFAEAGRRLNASAQEAESWIGGFEFLQALRLQVQLRGEDAGAAGRDSNLVEVATLNDIDRRILKESFRVARRLQQRIELDFVR